MRKIALALALALALLLSATTGATLINVAKANFIAYLPETVIKSDGTIEPETEYINQTGNVYTLTANLTQKYAIRIQCSNIVLDGAGHSIDGFMKGENAKYVNGYANTGLLLEGVTSVTVKDLAVSGFMNHDISLENCDQCVVLRVKANNFYVVDSHSNIVTESNIGLNDRLLMRFSTSNKFARNNITSIDISSSKNNVFYENNFASNCVKLFTNEANSWDNGSVGNYWSDYSIEYPNATEIGNTGIGETPYVINANNTDNYPLMKPFEVPPSPRPQPEAESFPAALAVAVSGASVAVALTGLLLFLRKRNHSGTRKKQL